MLEKCSIYNKGVNGVQRNFNFSVLFNALYLAVSDILLTHTIA